MEVKTLLITQARLGSSRLPGKVLKTIQGKTLLQIHLDRLRSCKRVDTIVVATTTNPADAEIAQLSQQWGYASFRGSEQDVLDRFYQAARTLQPTWVVRVTSDCPLLDPKLVDKVIDFAQQQQVDYCANVIVENFPDGQDVEVFRFSALERAWHESTATHDREHVTPYIRNNSTALGKSRFSSVNYPSPEDFSKIRMTVDEPRDFDLIERLITDLGAERSWEEYTSYIIDHQLGAINFGIIRNEALRKNLKGE